MPPYTPPYPGAVQDELAWHLVKYLADDVRVLIEHEVEVAVNDRPAFYVLDFLLSPGEGSRRVALEVNTARTLRQHERQLRRDATLIHAKAAEAIYRVRAGDAAQRVEDVLYLISKEEPRLFSERGRVNLTTLSSQAARMARWIPRAPSLYVPYPSEDADHPPHLLLRRLDHDHPDVWMPYTDLLP